jgi:tRNA nucleotidyltransferase (CCA-adding enzyme)
MKCYLVGGAVRDRLLGYPCSERDWVVVGATPDEMIRAGFRPVGRDFPVFLHPETGEEYALARTERKSGRGYHGFTFHTDPGVTLEEDLARRDLTINAIAEDEDGTLIDPYRGREDIERRLLRHVSPAFAEDPLRVLRIARFAARYHHLGFRVAEETTALMRMMVANGEVDHLVPERIWKETERALGERHPEIYFHTLAGVGALERVSAGALTRLSPTADSALRRAAACGFSGEVRFATLLTGCDSARVDALCRYWKVPNSHAELARFAIAPLAQALQLHSPQQAFELFERCDALRRPDRFRDFIDLCDAEGASNETLERLRRALAAGSAVTAAELVASGLKGEQLGAALRQRRRAAIEASWQ